MHGPRAQARPQRQPLNTRLCLSASVSLLVEVALRSVPIGNVVVKIKLVHILGADKTLHTVLNEWER